MRGVVFQMGGGGSFLSGGCPIGEALVLMGGFEESCRMAAAPPMPPSHYGRPWGGSSKFDGGDGLSQNMREHGGA